eukprot:CAMPEP_0181215646 /NCGR_PEP_ID=MMETSP1096-20121128/26128_1 /TAXON_ID=156174 ORGANISM="Chrysochromulina ericina, Strain CCMP281" /NCGR_SAMPLE_ID=MMETSP1096 /ASSEMBLY_ACC=CAM_ASM_000453 /LENGTH=136 /DNA_ID=CAMNT_0023307523 /DNA_START=44 /DNA_END=451 /DNA_ORIENTATION=+
MWPAPTHRRPTPHPQSSPHHVQHAPLSSLPAALGGLAQWDTEEYIASRCAEEGTAPTNVAAAYKGRRLDLATFDELEANPDGMAARALKAVEADGQGSAFLTTCLNLNVTGGDSGIAAWGQRERVAVECMCCTQAD